MMQYNLPILAAFVLYLGAMLAIGIYYSRSQQRLSDYILGGRSWAVDYVHECRSVRHERLDAHGRARLCLLDRHFGVVDCIGIAIGTYLNWHFVSQRLRNYTEVANNSLTMPDYLKNRFHDDQNLIRIILPSSS